MGKTKELNIAYIGGGSRGWAWGLMKDLALEELLSGTVRLYDIDFDAAYANEVIGNNLSKREDAKGDWKYIAVKSLEEALTGADFIIISILPGSFELMRSDVHTPEKYGIYQSVGDTVGPGGILRAMRTVPMYVEIAEAIKKYSPNARVINYTNPMTVCVQTLYTIFPEIKAVGCCHEVFDIQNVMVKILDMKLGIKAEREEIVLNVKGINHFTWIDEASYKDVDLIPLFDEVAREYKDKGFSLKEEEEEDFFANHHKVTFDLYLEHSVIPVAGDRHISEFVGNKYLKNPGTVKEWGFGLTPVDWRTERREELIEQSKRLVSGEEQIDLRSSGEEGVKQIKALLGMENMITNVNYINRGQVENLPLGHIVETNVSISRDSLKPIFAGKFIGMPLTSTLRHIENQRGIVEAGIKKDKELAKKVFLNDTLVSTIPREEGKKMFEEMFEATKSELEGWK